MDCFSIIAFKKFFQCYLAWHSNVFLKKSKKVFVIKKLFLHLPRPEFNELKLCFQLLLKTEYLTTRLFIAGIWVLENNLNICFLFSSPVRPPRPQPRGWPACPRAPGPGRTPPGGPGGRARVGWGYRGTWRGSRRGPERRSVKFAFFLKKSGNLGVHTNKVLKLNV